jgi:hypothetical protein
MAKNPTPDEGGAQRAARLREQIKRIKEGAPRTPDSERATPPAKEKLSPNEYIERRMQDLDRKKK